jgi:hypothetical protein
MRKFLTKLFRRKATPVALPPIYQRFPVEEWTESDVSALRGFLGGPVGQKLLRRGRSMEAAVAVNACADAFHTSHSAGRAFGVSETLTWLESLTQIQISRETGDQVSKETSTSSQESEAEWVGRLSP